jgi:hypothetical protein
MIAADGLYTVKAHSSSKYYGRLHSGGSQGAAYVAVRYARSNRAYPRVNREVMLPFPDDDCAPP